MNATPSFPQITFRIPGSWAHPGELQRGLPEGYRLTPEVLILPDGTEVEFIPMPPDDQFPQIFRSSCRRPAREEELAIVDRYSVNVGLNGPGGSLEAARKMMRAGAAIVQAGGAGVFIDNSLLAHGGSGWRELADDGGAEALSFAFASIVQRGEEVYTLGMHTLGFPDLLMRHAELEDSDDDLIEILCYICDSEKPMTAGHVIADESGLRYQVIEAASDGFDPHSPVHNPFGRLRIVSLKGLAENN